MTERPPDLEHLCLHTITTRPWSLEDAVPRYAAAGVKGISVWREALNGRSPGSAGKLIRDSGLTVVSLVRGGFFAAAEKARRLDAVEENRRIIDEAFELSAPHVVLVCGSDPAQPLAESRKQIREAIEALLSHAEEAGVKLAVEPLHPMYADSRSAVNTLREANDMVEAIASPWVGLVVDVYHLWWDPDLEGQIRRCGALGNLLAFHICDWKVPTEDMLHDRGLMGEGCIPVRRIRGWVEAAGFAGFNEVEIFSTKRWAQNQESWLGEIVKAYRDCS
jgi:sugar phosphate isomerase/epimerase